MKKRGRERKRKDGVKKVERNDGEGAEEEETQPII